ncbi:Ribosomal protein L30, ferredoxin-like fold domain [Pseudocohnilembus persalinus]|uniref:Ribosomal protein L30, ferredoxin-like fold domain n=1 Tax=Pseudocohnilembus persalinus TaxID=266149 RepID=A0A0V0R351_PSEPJ|nr:Ribosomal protein L30, ferredoxin-like fold domain [Pseudocohnilembus persalinus]|eukprot:KRX08932.1 Ribosomal protein L30, ferredoxin-like fold domain [Pseudocohnilembus persalinus]
MSSKTFVPENVLKKQTRDTKFREAAEQARKERQQKNKARKQEYIERAEKYQQEYLKQEQQEVENKRTARHGNQFYIPAQPKVALIVRIRGINQLHPVVKKTLRLFRLRQIHNATFVKVNKATTNMIKRILPYVTLGYPSRHLIRRMIYKRGYGKVNGQRIPLQSNEVIEQSLGKFDIKSIEDLIHEIVTCGPHFKEANNFLWPFKLNNPRGGYNNKRHPFHTGGDWGNREQFINDFVEAMI